MPHLTRVAENTRNTGKAFAVMLCDLNHFKRINNVYGHASGDAVLVKMTKRLRGGLRVIDMVARIDGEKFMIVMPGTTLKEARSAAHRFCNLIGGRPFDIPGSAMPIPITISIGIALDNAAASYGGKMASAPHDADFGKGLMEQADKALYAAKMKGRNQVKLSRPAA